MYGYLDTETRCPLDIKRAGTVRYTEECTALSVHWIPPGPNYTQPDAEPHTLQVWRQEMHRPVTAMPDHLECTWVAHNAMFDRHVMGALVTEMGKPERWLCTAALARYFGLPGSLHDAGHRVRLPTQLLKHDDSGGIARFSIETNKDWCTPEQDPERWAQFMEYADQDVRACRALLYALVARMGRAAWRHWLDREQAVYHLDQRINDRGFQVDLETTDSALRMIQDTRPLLDLAMRGLTRGEVTKLQSPKLLPYLASEFLMQVPDLTKRTVRELLDGELDPRARALLELRQSGARNSLAKYGRFEDMVSPDSRVRGAYLYHGAHTGRPSGQGVQPQNLTRPTDDLEPGQVAADIRACAGNVRALAALYPGYNHRIFDVLLSGIRGAVVAPVGKRLVIADYNQIEARLIAWFSGCVAKLEAFRAHDAGESLLDPYEVTAQLVLGDHRRRQEGKALDLGLGFGMGPARHAYETRLPLAVATEQVYAWRDQFHEIPALWRATQTAFRAAIRNPGNAYTIAGGRLSIHRDRHKVGHLVLPSGKTIFYHGLRFASWGECLRRAKKLGKLKEEQVRFSREFDRPFRKHDHVLVNDNQIVFTGTHGEQRFVHGGFLTENFIQATAREIFVEHLLDIERETGETPVLHSYDEGVWEVEESWAEAFVDAVTGMMCRTPNELPGLPLQVEVKVRDRYTK